MRIVHHAAVVAALLIVALAAVSLADVEPTPDPSFISVVDWSFVAVAAFFGLIGSLARINPARKDQATFTLLTGGMVAGLSLGCLLAEVGYFHHRPLPLLGFVVAAGYGGTVVLDLFAARLFDVARRVLVASIRAKGGPDA